MTIEESRALAVAANSLHFNPDLSSIEVQSYEITLAHMRNRAREDDSRRTPEEQALHKEAVRLRSMSDRQLVEQFHRAAEPEMAASVPRVAQDGAEASTPIGNTSAVQMLLAALSEGKCKGIKGATAYKVAQFAAEMGLV